LLTVYRRIVAPVDNLIATAVLSKGASYCRDGISWTTAHGLTWKPANSMRTQLSTLSTIVYRRLSSRSLASFWSTTSSPLLSLFHSQKVASIW